MKRIFSFLAVLILILAVSYAKGQDASTLYVAAEVPENYGVAFPDDALRFGDFVFEVKFDIDIKSELEVDNVEGKTLLTNDKLSIGEIQPGLGNFNFTLVYYGNLSKTYRTEILVDPNIVWKFEGDELVTVPIEIKLKRNENCSVDIISDSYRIGQAYIEIPPTGPREDVPVLDVEVSWDGGRDLIPGVYTTELKLDMRVL